ncbi:MAG: efflux RND transporter permease subunit [Treponemataceae bacterium]|nr:MAG: efflux RND transporter permease subunit [Treponemataceae bacterium]
MNISELSVKKPVTITMIYVAIIVIAVIFLPRLGIALYPDVTNPVLTVRTTYSNVGPEEIDKNVTQVLSKQLRRVSGLKTITSTSSTGSSQIRMSFGYNKNLDEAINDINTGIARVLNSLPDGCGTPTVMKFDMNSMPIMRLAVTGDLNLDELRQIAEDTVVPLLESVEGVASAEVNGGATREIRVDVSANRLEAYGLTLTAITGALAARNVQVSNGTITQDAMDYEIITDEYYKSLDDIRSTVLKTAEGASIRLDDIGEVYEQNDRKGRRVYINGEPGIYISVSNESGTNPSAISRGVNEKLQNIEANLPRGVHVTVLSDDTSLIDSTMAQVYSSGIAGAALAMFIIFVFLRSIKSSIIVGLAMPISILITLMAMSILELTVNMMTMAGLILGMGMTVDSSIVILENISKRRAWGEKSAVAAVLGSRNMILAIMASALTTICVFLPIIIYRADLEMYGQLFQELIITVIVSLVASLFVAVTLVPALAGSIMRIDTRTQKPLKNPALKKLDAAIAGRIAALENGYARALQFCLKNRLLVLALVFSMTAFSVYQLSRTGMNLMPNSNADDQINITITLPIGSNTTETRRYLFDFQEIIMREIPRAVYKAIILNTGAGNSGTIQITLPPLQRQTMKVSEIQKTLMPFTNQWSDVRIAFSTGRFFGGSSSANVANIVLKSDDPAGMTKAANDVVALLKTFPYLIEVTTDLENGSPRYEITINTDAASLAGVSVNTITALLRIAIAGTTATVYHDGAENVDIIVSLGEDTLTEPAALGAIPVQTSNGLMALDNFISYKETGSPQRISREEGVRLNKVTAKQSPNYSYPVTEIQAQVEQAIAENIVLPDSVKLSYEGQAQDIKKYNGILGFVILLAVFLVFAIMAAQFESLVDPLIIFASIPLLSVGVWIVYALMGQTLSLFSLVGIVALVGIVVNNGIVLVDFTNQLVSQKMPVFAAAVSAGKNRLQPIMMTTLTTVLGMAPMAFFPGQGAAQMQPICLTIVGGLLSGALMTLFVSPVLYSLLNKRREKRFDDPESLMNQIIEVDGILRSGKQIDIIQ